MTRTISIHTSGKVTAEAISGTEHRITMPADATVFDDMGRVAAAQEVKPGYSSEIATVMHNPNPVLVAEATDPLPTDFGEGTIDEQVGRLLQWQISHSWFKPQIYIDGPNKHGYPGTEPGVYFSTTTVKDKLTLDPGRSVPVQPATVEVMRVPPSGAVKMTIPPPRAGQQRLAFDAKDLDLTFTDQYGHGIAFLRLVAQNGGEVTGRIQMFEGTRLLLDAADINAFAAYWTVERATWSGDFTVAAHADIQLLAADLNTPVWIDYRTASH